MNRGLDDDLNQRLNHGVESPKNPQNRPLYLSLELSNGGGRIWLEMGKR